MQKGGIVIKREYENYNAAFSYFLDNCTCTMLSYRSRGGLILKLIFTGLPERSPFLSFNSNNVLKPITELIIKLCFINENKDCFYFPFIQDGRLATTFNDITQENFNREIETQIDIYKRSLDEYLEPICPSVITYKTIRDNTDKLDFIKKLLSKVPVPETNMNDTYAKIYLQQIIKQQMLKLEKEAEATENVRLLTARVMRANDRLEKIKADIDNEKKKGALLSQDMKTQHAAADKELRQLKIEKKRAVELEDNIITGSLDNFRLGYIVMECLSGFMTVFEQRKTLTPSGNKFVTELIIFELYRLYQLGYLHGDVNQGNFMVNMNYAYVSNFPGRVIIIDFGSTYKVPIQPISLMHIMDVVALSKMTPIPQYSTPEFRLSGFNQQTYISWMWLWDTLTERDMYNSELNTLSQNRETIKNRFRDYTRLKSMDASIGSEIDFVNRNAGTESVGGSLDVMRDTITFKPDLSLASSDFVKEKLTVKEINDVNIFDQLDLDHKLTDKNISNYIKHENEYADNLLKQLNEMADDNDKSVSTTEKGGQKRQKINKKTKKNKKSKRK